MKTAVRILGLLGLAIQSTTVAQAIILSQSPSVMVPDNDTVGVLSRAEILGATGVIGEVSLTLELVGDATEGGYNGDLYAYLRHGTGFAVLLNRPGRRVGSLGGYGDDGMSLTFSDTASSDIHDYRVALGGAHEVALSGPLAGSWRPDGRDVDPLLTVDYGSVGRMATFSSFQGLSPNGDWDLHVFDLASGGQVELRSWSLVYTAVPEPRLTGLGSAFCLVGFGMAWKRWREEG